MGISLEQASGWSWETEVGARASRHQVFSSRNSINPSVDSVFARDLSARVTASLQARLSARESKELASLNRETDPEMYCENLLVFAKRLADSGKLRESAEVLAGLQFGNPFLEIKARADAALRGLRGGQGFESFLGQFIPQATDYRLIAPLLLGTFAYQGTRFASLRHLSSNPRWLAQGQAALLGLGAETTVFLGAHRALTALGGAKGSDASILGQDWLSTALSLGVFKFADAGGLRLSRRIGVQTPTARNLTALLPQASAFGALLLNARLQRPTGPAAPDASLLGEAFAGLVTLRVGADLARRLAPNFGRFSVELNQRANAGNSPRNFPWLGETQFAPALAQGAPILQANPKPIGPTILQMSAVGNEPAPASPFRLDQDLGLFVKRPSLVERIPQLSSDLEFIFEQGGRILSTGSKYLLVGPVRYSGFQPTEAHYAAYLAWQGERGFKSLDFDSAQKAWRELQQRLASTGGLRLHYLYKGNSQNPDELLGFKNSPLLNFTAQLVYLEELSKILPKEVWGLAKNQRKVLQSIMLNLDPHLAAQPSGTFQDRTTLHLYYDDLKGSRQQFAGKFLHGIGQSVAGYFRDDEALQKAYRDILAGKTLWGLLDWAEGAQGRGEILRSSYDDFLAEVVLTYVVHGEELRDRAKYSATKFAWDTVYEEIRNVFGGKEYGIAAKETPVEPAHVTTAPISGDPAYQGGRVGPWALDMIPSLGVVGRVAAMQGEQIVLHEVSFMREGKLVEADKIVLHGATSLGELKAGQKVHWMPKKP